MHKPKKIYLQTCGMCECHRTDPVQCTICEIGSPIHPGAVTWSEERIYETDAEYVRADIYEGVLEKVYSLLKDQKEYFKTKNSALMQSCRTRENEFIRWYEERKKSQGQQELNLEES